MKIALFSQSLFALSLEDAIRTTAEVGFEGLQRQPDAAYRVVATPGWRAGSVWVEERRKDGFTVRFDEGPRDDNGRLDFILTRSPERGVLTQ